MTWEQKLQAIKALSGRAELCMREPGDWYLSADMSIGGNGMLTGSYGNGSTPQEAVEAHWDIYSGLAYDRYAVVYKNGEDCRARWNGFMWDKVIVEKAA